MNYRTPHRHAVLVFLDGVGIGPPDPTINPFLRWSLPTLHGLFEAPWPTVNEHRTYGRWRNGSIAKLYAADARLDVTGLPQSGTGTTSLLTGVNAAATAGEHAGPYPPATIRPILKAYNLFARVKHTGGSVTLANAFPPFYFARLRCGRARRTTMTQAALAAGLQLRTVDDLRRGEALSAFITLERWRKAVSDLPPITPREAGNNLARLAKGHHLTAFEYFRTDHLGHRPDMNNAQQVLADVDELLAGLFEALDPTRDLVIVASDHGNCEDLSSTRHTHNPVPIIIWGQSARPAIEIARITDVVPFLLTWLSNTP